MGEVAYLFIDGAYLETSFQDTVRKVFGSHHEIDYRLVKNQLGAGRVFYYDCIDNNRYAGESEGDYTLRVQHKKSASMPSIHWRVFMYGVDIWRIGKEEGKRNKKSKRRLTFYSLWT